MMETRGQCIPAASLPLSLLPLARPPLLEVPRLFNSASYVTRIQNMASEEDFRYKSKLRSLTVIVGEAEGIIGNE